MAHLKHYYMHLEMPSKHMQNQVRQGQCDRGLTNVRGYTERAWYYLIVTLSTFESTIVHWLYLNIGILCVVEVTECIYIGTLSLYDTMR